MGGTKQAYLTSDYPVDLSEQFIKLHCRDGDGKEFRIFNFPKEEQEFGITGTCMLGKDRMAAYNSEGFYAVDLKRKEYYHKKYSTSADVLDEKETEQLDYKDCVTGYTSMEGVFAFSTVSGNQLCVHEVMNAE